MTGPFYFGRSPSERVEGAIVGKFYVAGVVATAVGLIFVAALLVARPLHQSKPRLEFIGDSITFQSFADIHTHFDQRFDVGIEAFEGTTTYDMAGLVANEAKLDPAVEVIELGTNDARLVGRPLIVKGVEIQPAQTMTDITDRFDWFAAQAPVTTCVVFVTVNSHDPTWNPAAARAINAHIRANFRHVADWDAAYEPDYFHNADNPHPNEVGRQALLAVEDRAIAGCK